MSFLAPLFLLGLGAIALPIVFHLIRRSVKEKQVFSSLMFLLPSPPRLTRRSRLEHLLLLLLRCAAIVLLATAFARPFLRQAVPPDASGSSAKRILVLLDTSASMRRSDLWKQAQEKVEAIAARAGPQDELAVFTFDRQFRALLGFSDWKSVAPGERLVLLSTRLKDTTPGWGGTWLDQALIEAAEMIGDGLADTADTRREIVVISDLQEGSRVSGLQSHEWPRNLFVTLERLLPARTGNAGLQVLPPQPGVMGPEPSSTRLRVSNSADSKREQYRVRNLDATPSQAQEVYVPAGQSRIVSLRSLSNLLTSAHLVLEGDDEPFDNEAFVLPAPKAHYTILYVGADAESDPTGPLFFLKRALQDTGQESIRIIRRDPSSPLPETNIASATLVVCTAASERQAGELSAAVKNGKTLLLAPANAETAANLGAFLELADFAAPEGKATSYAMLGEIEFKHPLFTPFADSRYSDFTKIHFWKYRQMNAEAIPSAHVLARFDTGDPAILEVPRGAGRVFILASGWNPADSQLALSSKFVPLLYSFLELSGAAPPPAAQYFIGESVPLPVLNVPSTVRLPNNATVTVVAGGTNFNQALVPGIYSLALTQGGTYPFAVNLDPNESRTAPLPIDELERLGVPMAKPSVAPAIAAAGRAQLKNAEIEARQKLWRWVIVFTLVIVAVETWLAGRTMRRLVPSEAKA